MDSLTQFALGAAVGEAAAGKSLGRRALVWGGLAGILPDLDVLAAPFQTAAEALRFHRGPTHSLLFAFVAAPLLAWLASRYYRGRKPDLGAYRPWLALFFWALWTHPILDYFTIYGTQLLWPFTDRPFGRGSVFIIDLVYSLPLFYAVGRGFFRRARRRRWPAVRFALVWSTLYLGWGLAAQAYAGRVMEAGLRETGIEPRRMLTMASPFNTLYWYGLAETDTGFVATSYSLFDGQWAAHVHPIPKRAALFDALRDDPAGETLNWFSRGFWSMKQDGDTLFLRDLRFGRADGWQEAGDEGYVFTFRLVPQPGAGWTFVHERPSFDARRDFGRLGARVLGAEP